MSTELSASARNLVPVACDVWEGPALFAVPKTVTPDHRLVEARKIADGCGVELHDFFTLAASHPDLLQLWASQEAVVTGPFSQLLLFLTAQIQNVHIRANFLEVAYGEHNGVKNGQALYSHPWLLYRLCLSCDLDLGQVRALPATVRFLSRLVDEMDDLQGALGAFGVGNERMLLTEYAAVQNCFSIALPDTDYQDFLRANIAEDTAHSEIIELVATALADGDGSFERYIQGATNGVKARMDYYDDLVTAWKEHGLPDSWRHHT